MLTEKKNNLLFYNEKGVLHIGTNTIFLQLTDIYIMNMSHSQLKLIFVRKIEQLIWSQILSKLASFHGNISAIYTLTDTKREPFGPFPFFNASRYKNLRKMPKCFLHLVILDQYIIQVFSKIVWPDMLWMMAKTKLYIGVKL